MIAVDATRASVGDRSSQEYFLKRHVRFVVIDGADAASFAYVDLGYARDRRNMYYDGVRFDVKDLATFTLLKDGYAKDRLTGYYHQPLTRDPASFRVLSLGYAIEKDAVFYEGVPMAGADPATFAMLNAPMDSADARDARAMYHQGKRTLQRP